MSLAFVVYVTVVPSLTSLQRDTTSVDSFHHGKWRCLYIRLYTIIHIMTEMIALTYVVVVRIIVVGIVLRR